MTKERRNRCRTVRIRNRTSRGNGGGRGAAEGGKRLTKTVRSAFGQLALTATDSSEFAGEPER